MSLAASLVNQVFTKNELHFNWYKPHAKQMAFHEAGKCAKERLFLAGNRTGKTYCGAIEVAAHLTGNYPPNWNGHIYSRPVKAWVVGVSNHVVRDSLQKQYYLGDEARGEKGLIHNSLIVQVKRATGIRDFIDTVYVKHASGGISQLSFKSYEQGREKFQGDKVELIHVDEEMPMNIYMECLMRTTATSSDFHGMIIVTMTPLKGVTELVNHFTENRHPETIVDNRYHIVATWDDNPHLPLEEKNRLLAAMTENEKKARTLGIPWSGTGLVYPIFENSFLCEPFEIPSYWPRVYAIDFGWRNTAVLFCAHDLHNDIAYLYGEYCIGELTPDKHVFNLQHTGIGSLQGVFDPAGRQSQQADGRKLVELYRQAGLRHLSPAENDVSKGILTVLQRIEQGRLKIFKNLIKTRSEMQKYSYDNKGCPIKENDHLMDCMRYIMVSGLKIARASTNSNIHVDGAYKIFPNNRSNSPGYI